MKSMFKRLKPYIKLAIALTAVYCLIIGLALTTVIIMESSIPLGVLFTVVVLGLAVYVAVIMREERK